jgi:inhibitor of KinA
VLATSGGGAARRDPAGRVARAGRRFVNFRAASDQSLLAYLGEAIGLESHQRVVRLLRALERERPAWLRNVNPAYCSLLVTFDAASSDHAQVEQALTRLEREAENLPAPESRMVEIPVCYGGAFGPDLDAVAAARGLAPERVIELHAAETYRSYFLGFAPGFAYLGDVPGAIATARHVTPRRSVPAGSVGIAGRQTGVYPFSTPGGWQILGRTPLEMFRAERSEMSLIALGDRVRFHAITADEFERLRSSAGSAPNAGAA